MHQLAKYVGTVVLTGGLLLTGLGLTSQAPAPAAQKEERHPHIRRAIEELREARRELRESDHDFGGHRKEAIEAVDRAIRQLEEALRHDRR
jgi:transcription elongation GreA/GreB family factor